MNWTGRRGGPTNLHLEWRGGRAIAIGRVTFKISALVSRGRGQLLYGSGKTYFWNENLSVSKAKPRLSTVCFSLFFTRASLSDLLRNIVIKYCRMEW